MPPSSVIHSCAWYSQVGGEQSPPDLGSRKSCQHLEFLAFSKDSGWGDYDAKFNKPNSRRGREGGEKWR